MKNIRLALFLITVLVSLSACKKEKEAIDLSNIEDLYSQPLSVIQKCIQGEWNWYASYGGFVGINYPQDTYVKFTADSYTVSSPEDTYTIPFTWKKVPTYTYEHDGEETYVMWNEEQDEGMWFFGLLKNDSLSVIPYFNGDPSFHKTFEYTFVRVVE
jgi:hypothetical protein